MPSIADKAVDLDGDGYVDNVMVILKASQSSKASSSATLVAHKSDYSGSAKINNKPVVGLAPTDCAPRAAVCWLTSTCTPLATRTCTAIPATTGRCTAGP